MDCLQFIIVYDDNTMNTIRMSLEKFISFIAHKVPYEQLNHISSINLSIATITEEQ